MTCENIDISLLPQMLQDLVALIELSATMKIVSEYGGTTLYIPVRQLTDNHKLIRVIGRKAAELLQGEYRGEELSIPTAFKAIRAVRNKEICAKRRYMSGSMLAREYNMSERNIRNICKGMEEDAEVK